MPGFLVGVDDGVDPTADPLVDLGVNSQIRILGIGGNETTGQQRVPVIITSLHDSTVGTTVRGVDQSIPIPSRCPVRRSSALARPQAGDGGLIYFGGNSLTDYNLLDPRDGNLIDNADIRYITRIEMQGGGIVDVFNTNAEPDRTEQTFDVTTTLASDDKPRLFPDRPSMRPDDARLDTALNQYNAARAMTISNSNLANLSSAGSCSTPAPTCWRATSVIPPGPGPPPSSRRRLRGGIRRRAGRSAWSTTTRFANMPIGVRVNSETGTSTTTQQDADYLALLNNTFYNDAVGAVTSGDRVQPRDSARTSTPTSSGWR